MINRIIIIIFFHPVIKSPDAAHGVTTGLLYRMVVSVIHVDVALSSTDQWTVYVAGNNRISYAQRLAKRQSYEIAE